MSTPAIKKSRARKANSAKAATASASTKTPEKPQNPIPPRDLNAAQQQSADLHNARRRTVWKEFRRNNKSADGMLVTHAPDVRYLTGMVEGAAYLLISPKGDRMVIHKMYQDVGPKEAHGVELHVVQESPLKTLKAMIAPLDFGALAFPEERITHAGYRAMRKELRGVKLEPATNLVGPVRQAKDEDELKLLRRVCKIAEIGFRDLIKQGASAFIGRTEKELALELENRMREKGADRQGFPGGMIVAAGPNSASCHHFPSNRKIKDGDIVLFDWGAELDGYRSDMTRVVFIRSVPDQMANIYPVVRQACEESEALVKAGRKAASVDKHARDIIEQAGHGEMRHGLGHGIGLEVHEHPFLGRAKELTLKENVVITIEPGIYFDNIGGVRLENMVRVGKDGPDRLNALPMELKKFIIR